jgi:SWI/SNF-related matrix-associated actin-dependent regulator of chromatin subfamily A member 5
MLRRLKADVEKSLLPKHETILFTGMSKMQKELYRNILIRDIGAIKGSSGNRTAILNIVMQLRKCAGHPYLFPGVEDRTLPPLGKFELWLLSLGCLRVSNVERCWST